MKKSYWLLAFWSLLLMGCSTIPASVQKEALPPMPFKDLIQQADQHIGETVILGGYILDVRNLENETRVVAIQVPLDADQKPKERKLTQGLIRLKHNGQLDPKVYPKNSKITVAGILSICKDFTTSLSVTKL